jgi:hypothetical protein
MPVVSVVCCEVEGMCDGPIPRSEKSYRLWRVIVCDLVNSTIRRPWPALGGCAREVGGWGVIQTHICFEIEQSAFYLQSLFIFLVVLRILLAAELTPWSRVLPEKPSDPQLLKKFPPKVHYRIHKSPTPIPFLVPDQSSPCLSLSHPKDPV